MIPKTGYAILLMYMPVLSEDISMEVVRYINYIIGLLFVICFAYQLFYIAVPWFKKGKENPNPKLHRFGVLIAARNESNVIDQLVGSIMDQNYPKELVTVFVVADNCTDNTAEVARNAGAVVYERFNREQVGKGYALDYLLSRIGEDYGPVFDGFLVFDADNILDPNYIAEMNRVVDLGYEIITSYRNSKNYGDNWISAGYALWYLRESRYLNHSRMLMNTSCAISGTGFYVSRQVFERDGGWKYYLLTEDIEFTIDHVLQGYKIGFAEKAVLYDEQPVKFSQSWIQRLRWSKGFLQVWAHYGGKLVRNIFSKNFTSAYDMTMTIFPALFLTLACVLVNLGAEIVGLIIGVEPSLLFRCLFECIRNSYMVLFVIGLITTITEWKRIYCSPVRKILYTFTFPLFMLTYVPISVVALFKKVQWKPIAHTSAKKDFLSSVKPKDDPS